LIQLKTKQLILIVLAAVLFSCAGTPKEGQNTVNSLSQESKAELNESSSTDTARKLREERRIKGDTLALSLEDLQKYLPEKINGYKAEGKPKGELMDIPGMSFSQAEQVYKKGDSRMVILLFDYNSSYDMYAGTTALFSAPSVENQEESSKPISMKDNMKGRESYKKKEKKAELMLGIAERFYLNIKADKQEGTEFIKSTADRLDLEGLNKK
jgi:hypothetical protein